MKNILKISLIALLALSLMFCIVACGGEETPAPTPDNGGQTPDNGGTTPDPTPDPDPDPTPDPDPDPNPNPDPNPDPQPEPESGVWGEFVPIG